MNPEFAIGRYVSLAWGKRWWALAIAWIICLAGWAVVLALPNRYESSARIYVDSDAVLTPLLRGLTIDSAPANQVELLQRTLLSRPNLEKLIAKTNLDARATTDGQREALIQRLALDIKVQPQSRNLFSIAYQDTDPTLAYNVVRTIIGLFMESAIGNNRQEMEGARRFLQDQIASYEAQLRQAEKRRADFQAKYVDLLPGANGVSNLDNARRSVQSLDLQMQDMAARRTLLQAELAKTQPLLGADQVQGGGAAAARVAEAERALRELELRFTDKHPDVIAAKQHLAAVQAIKGGDGGVSASAARPVSNPAYEALRLRLVDADVSAGSLKRQYDEAVRERDRLEAIARREPEVQAEFTNIDRDYMVLRHNYEELLARRESMRIAQAASTDSDKVKLNVVDPPVVSSIPIGPHRTMLMAGVLAAGIGAGVAFAVGLSRLDQRFHGIADLRQFGLPVVGGVSVFDARIAEARRRAWYGSVVRFGVGLFLLCAVFAGLTFRPILLASLT